MSTPPPAVRLATRLAGRPTALDATIAGASFVLFSLPVLLTDDGEGPTWAIAVLGVAAVLPLVWRRRHPVAVLMTVVVVLAIAALTAVRFTPFVSNAGPALGVAAYSLAERDDRLRSLAWTVGAVAVTSVAAVIGFHLHRQQDQDFVQLVIAAVFWLVGDALRTRRSYRRELTYQHEARIRAEERLRVSRDVHDVVSHTLSMIAVRSGVARLVLDRRPEQVAEALGAIETASRDALDEVRAVLRDTRGAPSTAVSEPGLDELAGLVAAVREAGLDVRLSCGDERYDPVLETTVYRTVQEALTNVVKHAQASGVTVAVGESGETLTVEVIDDGTGPVGDHPPGLGLSGMRERVALLDGDVQVGPPSTGRGFAVHVTIPTAGRRRG